MIVFPSWDPALPLEATAPFVDFMLARQQLRKAKMEGWYSVCCCLRVGCVGQDTMVPCHARACLHSDRRHARPR